MAIFNSFLYVYQRVFIIFPIDPVVLTFKTNPYHLMFFVAKP